MSGNIERMERIERIDRIENDRYHGMDMRLVPEDCHCSGYTMAAVAGGLLLCLGIIIYALLVH